GGSAGLFTLFALVLFGGIQFLLALFPLFRLHQRVPQAVARRGEPIQRVIKGPLGGFSSWRKLVAGLVQRLAQLPGLPRLPRARHQRIRKRAVRREQIRLSATKPIGIESKKVFEKLAVGGAELRGEHRLIQRLVIGANEEIALLAAAECERGIVGGNR